MLNMERYSTYKSIELTLIHNLTHKKKIHLLLYLLRRRMTIRFSLGQRGEGFNDLMEEEGKREKRKLLQVSVSIEACCPDTLMVSFSDLEMMESKPFRKSLVNSVQYTVYSIQSKPFRKSLVNSVQCTVYNLQSEPVFSINLNNMTCFYGNMVLSKYS